MPKQRVCWPRSVGSSQASTAQHKAAAIKNSLASCLCMGVCVRVPWFSLATKLCAHKVQQQKLRHESREVSALAQLLWRALYCIVVCVYVRMHKRCINLSLHLILLMKVRARARNAICTHLLDANVTWLVSGSSLTLFISPFICLWFQGLHLLQLFNNNLCAFLYICAGSYDFMGVIYSLAVVLIACIRKSHEPACFNPLQQQQHCMWVSSFRKNKIFYSKIYI